MLLLTSNGLTLSNSQSRQHQLPLLRRNLHSKLLPKSITTFDPTRPEVYSSNDSTISTNQPHLTRVSSFLTILTINTESKWLTKPRKSWLMWSIIPKVKQILSTLSRSTRKLRKEASESAKNWHILWRHTSKKSLLCLSIYCFFSLRSVSQKRKSIFWRFNKSERFRYRIRWLTSFRTDLSTLLQRTNWLKKYYRSSTYTTSTSTTESIWKPTKSFLSFHGWLTNGFPSKGLPDFFTFSCQIWPKVVSSRPVWVSEWV